MKNKRSTNGWVYWLIVLIAAMLLSRCAKYEVRQGNTYDSYSLIIDRYTPDTSVLLLRTVWWHDDRIYLPEMKTMLDTIADRWELVCETSAIPLHLNHCYYSKNDIKIQPSGYPKN